MAMRASNPLGRTLLLLFLVELHRATMADRVCDRLVDHFSGDVLKSAHLLRIRKSRRRLDRCEPIAFGCQSIPKSPPEGFCEPNRC